MTSALRKLWPRTAPSSPCAPKRRDNQAVGNELLIEDRRVISRHFDPLSGSVRYGVGAVEQRVLVYNFSDQGLCFLSEVRYPIGASVEITMTLPRKTIFGGRTVCYLAKVVRVTLERGEFFVGASIVRCRTVASEDSNSGGSETEDRSRSAKTQPSSAGQRRTAMTSAHRERQSGRQFSRYRCASQVQFRVPGGDQIASGELTNLSLTGCYVHTSEPCQIGSDIEIVLQVGRTRIFSLGRVKLVKENEGMGVEFVGDLAQRLQRLPRFLNLVGGARQATK
jgi:hypothetical protein